MAVLHLGSLPPRTTKGTVVRLVVQVGGMPKDQVGKIELRGRDALVEVPARQLDRLVAAIDGANLGNHNVRAWREAEGGTGKTASGEGADHFDTLLHLLEIESAAEEAQVLRALRMLSDAEAEESGRAIVGVEIRDHTTGLGGRHLVTVGRGGGRPLPWTRLGPGTPVVVCQLSDREEELRGVVCQRDSQTLQIAFDDPPPWGGAARLRVDQSADEVARNRQRRALTRAQAAGGDRLSQLRAILLGKRPAEFSDAPDVLDEFTTGLDESQREAVRFALAARDVAIIHGPPGTGKTTTLVELICQAVKSGQRVLACAPSNLAVDNLLERLLAAGQHAVRLSHPARVLPQLRENTLDLLVERHADVRLARKLQRQAWDLRERAGRFRRAKPVPGARREMRDEARQLLEDARQLERQVVQHILDSTPIVCATLTAVDSDVLGQRAFDLAIIDEAAQTTEPACWIPLLRAERLVLAGDHCQLPPTILAREAVARGFGVSLMERLMQDRGPLLSRQLSVQYRMHEQIMSFSSDEFYRGSLQAHSSVAGHLLRDLPDVAATSQTTRPLTFIDTAGAGLEETQEEADSSRQNPGEARLVGDRVTQLLVDGLSPDQIAVITPYSSQVRAIRQRLGEHVGAGLEVDSVDGFQGREKEAIVISLVRSNPQGEIGFLADTRRTNVALTRARRSLTVIGDSATIGGHPFYARMLDYFEQHQAYHSVWELDQ